MINIFGSAKIAHISLVLTSLMLCLWHFGPLHGTVVALVLVFLSNIWLCGLLTAQALGILHTPDPLAVRLIWIVTCGLGVTIVGGGWRAWRSCPPRYM